MIQSRPSTDAYRSGWQRVFGKESKPTFVRVWKKVSPATYLSGRELQKAIDRSHRQICGDQVK